MTARARRVARQLSRSRQSLFKRRDSKTMVGGGRPPYHNSRQPRAGLQKARPKRQPIVGLKPSPPPRKQTPSRTQPIPILGPRYCIANTKHVPPDSIHGHGGHPPCHNSGQQQRAEPQETHPTRRPLASKRRLRDKRKNAVALSPCASLAVRSRPAPPNSEHFCCQHEASL